MLTTGERSLWKFYSSDGKLEQTGSYNNGRPDGLWKWYYESGAMLREESISRDSATENIPSIYLMVKS